MTPSADTAPAAATAAATVDLSANENPLGPSPRVVAALAAHLGEINRYPDDKGTALKSVLAARHGVGPEAVALGNGSSDLLDLAARAFLAPGDEAVMGWPCFWPYRSVVDKAHGVRAMVPLRDFGCDLGAMAARIGAATKLVIIGNPNNPTGTALGAAALGRFLDAVPAHVVVVLDEAYREYVRREDFPDSLSYVTGGVAQGVTEGAPVVVLRSLSKAYGLAGLRIGYAIASPDVIARLDGVRQHYNTNRLAQIAAIAALEDRDFLQRTLEVTAAGMRYLADELAALGLEQVPSEANFILVNVGDGEAVCRRLKESGILVQAMARFDLPAFIRVTVGLREENARFIAALAAIVAA